LKRISLAVVDRDTFLSMERLLDTFVRFLAMGE
jgi:hypothetical protein